MQPTICDQCVPTTFSESYAKLPGWAKVIVSLFLVHFGLAAAFMIMFALLWIVSLVPFVLFFVLALVHACASALT
jgi:hypothetical protein